MVNKGIYENFYISENILAYPGQLAIIKLSEPRLFIRFNYVDSIFASFDEWLGEMVDIQWMDGDKLSEFDKEAILTDCWNFLALTEQEEDRLADEIDDDEF